MKNIFSAVKNKVHTAVSTVKHKVQCTIFKVRMSTATSTATFNRECSRHKSFGRMFNGFTVGLATLICVNSAAFAAGGMNLGEGADFFNAAIDCLKVLVIALGIGLGGWGVINLLEGYGNDNPGAKSQGMKQLMAGAGVAVVGAVLIPKIKDVFA